MPRPRWPTRWNDGSRRSPARSPLAARGSPVWCDRGWGCRSYAHPRSIAANLSLSQRLVEYEAEREARLGGNCRVDRLTTSLSGGRRLPCRDRLLGHPHGQSSTLDQRRVVFRPVRDPVFGPEVFRAEEGEIRTRYLAVWHWSVPRPLLGAATYPSLRSRAVNLPAILQRSTTVPHGLLDFSVRMILTEGIRSPDRRGDPSDQCYL
jgi:hypothetical protein